MNPWSVQIEIDLTVVCKGSPTLQKWFLFNHTTLFSTKGLEKSLYDFTGTFFCSGGTHFYHNEVTYERLCDGSVVEWQVLSIQNGHS